jgi:hypothetical protein
MSIPGKDLLLFWRARITKNKLQKDRKRKENRDQRKFSSKIRLLEKRHSGPTDADVSAIRGRDEMKRVIILRLRKLWEETGEENSDSDTDFLYHSGLYTTHRRGEEWITAQNSIRGAVKSVRVQTTENALFGFSATLIKYSARLP